MTTMVGRAAFTLLIASVSICAFASDAAAQRSTTRRGSASRATAIRAELAGVLLQSRKYDDAAREYATLLQSEPRSRVYRLGLARALAWGGRLREAERELTTLSTHHPGDPTAESLLISVRSGLKPRAGEAANWLAQRPHSAQYRRILARALARDGRTRESLAHYDTLLFARPLPDVLVDRAYVHLERRDVANAERDLHASIASKPTPEAHVALGDLHRWRGDLEGARAWYIRARVLRPDAPEVTAAFARLARDQRPAVAFIPLVNDAPGWETTNRVASDNLGAQLVISELRRGLRKPLGFDGSAGFTMLRLSDRAAVTGSAAQGYGADVALSRDAAHRQLYARARARAGFVYHPSADLLPDAAATLAAWAGAWGVGAEVSTGPAYPSLVTLASFVPVAEQGGQLRERNTTFSLAGPLAAADVALQHKSTALSDGNARSSVQGYARLPAHGRLALLYSASVLSFAQASERYWSPERYLAHSAGAEYALRKVRGFTFAARALPGVAWTSERDTLPDQAISRAAAMQLTAGVESSYRAQDWEIGAALSYGRGRAGGYERVDAVIRARYVP